MGVGGWGAEPPAVCSLDLYHQAEHYSKYQSVHRTGQGL